MRTLYTLILMLYTGIAAHAQGGCYQYFEAPNDSFRKVFVFDASHHNNSWQIGKPDKLVFTSSLSVPNGIVTDTAHTYPVNDTSIFIIKLATDIPIVGRNYRSGSMLTHMTFQYLSDMDTNEIAKIEIADSSYNWKSILTDSLLKTGWMGYAPDFRKQTTTWTSVTYNFIDKFNHKADTLFIRFTFISDSIETNKDGWMMDNFFHNYYWESIDEVTGKDAFSLYPNPTTGRFSLRLTNKAFTKGEIVIYDVFGRKVYYQHLTYAARDVDINAGDLPKGVYSVVLTIDGNTAMQRLTIK